jgi:excisionase family DNA binding protein
VQNDTGTLVERLNKRQALMTADELAELLGTSVVQVYRLAKRGDLPSFRIATCVRFDPRVVAKWLEGISPRKESVR